MMNVQDMYNASLKAPAYLQHTQFVINHTFAFNAENIMSSTETSRNDVGEFRRHARSMNLGQIGFIEMEAPR